MEYYRKDNNDIDKFIIDTINNINYINLKHW